jgi:hypothetical protein
MWTGHELRPGKQWIHTEFQWENRLLRSWPSLGYSKSFAAFYRTWKFVTMFTRARHWTAARTVEHSPSYILETARSTEFYLVRHFVTCYVLVSSPSIFITVWQLRSCFCGAPSLTRGWVCLLYMLLALARAIFLESEFLGTPNHILLSQIWDFPFRRLLRLAGSQWRYSTPPPHGLLTDSLASSCFNCPPYNSFARTEQKTQFPTVTLLSHAYPLLRERVYRDVA